MFVVMAFVNPNPGKEEEMANRMRSFRNVLQTKSGLVKTFVLMERDGKVLVGVSMWTEEAAYQGAMASMQASAQSPPPDRLRESPPTMRQFFEI
jgi:heme-degrading monooxygenase HmoA